jgi:Tol biopolymer transport system component
MKKVLLTCLGLLLVSPIFAQFSLEQVLSSAFPSELKASPVKNQIAWVFNQTGSRNIFLAEAPDFKPRKLTNYEGDNGQEINSITFLPNGKSLLFIRGGANNSAGEIPNPAELQGSVERAIFKIDLDGKNLKKVVNGAYPRVSPNGSTLAYITGGQIWTLNLDSANISPKNYSILVARKVLSDGLPMVAKLPL